MEIKSVIPQDTNGPSSTLITAIDKDDNRVLFFYSHTYELLRDPKNPTNWFGWNGGTLTEAIQLIINLNN